MKKKIITPRGTFMAEEFKTEAEARKLGFGYYFTNDDGTDIYTKHIDMYHCEFGVVLKISSPKVGAMYQLSDGGVYIVAAYDKHNPNDCLLVRPIDGYILIARNAVVDYSKNSSGVISWDYSKKGYFVFD